METINIASIGGGNGLGAVMAGLAMLYKQPIKATAIITIVDDGDTSTGNLRIKTNGPGYYGDTTRILAALHKVVNRPYRGWTQDLTVRFPSGIKGGQTFGDLFAVILGRAYTSKMRRKKYRKGCVETILRSFVFQNTQQSVRVLKVLLELFDYPLETDNFRKHSLCNYLLFAIQKVAERQGLSPEKALDAALEAAHAFYRIPPYLRVLPVTKEPGILMAETQSGRVIEGQHRIDFREHDADPYDRIKRLWIDPPVSASQEAIDAILGADAVIISCGSLSGNVFGPFLVGGLKEALAERAQRSPLPIIYVMNLMTKIGETRFEEPFSAAQVVQSVREAIGQQPNCVIFNTRRLLDEDLRDFLPEQQIALGSLDDELPTGFKWPPLFTGEFAKVARADAQGLSKIVHDPGELAVAFSSIFSLMFPQK